MKTYVDFNEWLEAAKKYVKKNIEEWEQEYREWVVKERKRKGYCYAVQIDKDDRFRLLISDKGVWARDPKVAGFLHAKQPHLGCVWGKGPKIEISPENQYRMYWELQRLNKGHYIWQDNKAKQPSPKHILVEKNWLPNPGTGWQSHQYWWLPDGKLEKGGTPFFIDALLGY